MSFIIMAGWMFAGEVFATGLVLGVCLGFYFGIREAMGAPDNAGTK